MSRGKFNKSCCRVALPLAREIIFLRKNGELQVTERGLARCGILQTESGEKNQSLAKNFFHFLKLRKN